MENPEMKTCTKCGELKSLSEFYNRSDTKDGKVSHCRTCVVKRTGEYSKKHFAETAEYRKKYYDEIGRARAGNESMYKNKYCSLYLGVIVGERLCRHLFNDVVVMSFGNRYYDIICNKGKKIDVKTGCMQYQTGKNPRWRFHINHNKIADYFMLIAFDTLEKLTPLHMWMIPGNEINNHISISISTSTIKKWDKWICNIDDTVACCTELKTIKNVSSM